MIIFNLSITFKTSHHFSYKKNYLYRGLTHQTKILEFTRASIFIIHIENKIFEIYNKVRAWQLTSSIADKHTYIYFFGE